MQMKNYIIEIKWAVIFSVVILLWMLLEKISGLHSTHIDKHMYLTNLFAIPAILIYVFALKDKKKNFYNDKISYKQGIISGFVLSILITLISPLTQWITSYIITPEYFTNVIKYSLETGYHSSLEEAEAYFSYKNYVVQGAFGALIMGIVTSLIVMIFLRTKKKQ